MPDFERRAGQMGLVIPDFTKMPYFGLTYGSMKSHHLMGNWLTLSGHVPELPDGVLIHTGRLGADLTIEKGYEAARQTALNCLGGIRLAVGTLNRVKSIIRSLNFVVCTPDFHDVNKVSSGCTDLFRDVFGEEAGLGGRATIGVTSLARNNSFECWLDVEVTDA
jgi:hypothetical protein